jgi:multimeric flavodoxin WrbA
MKISLYDLDFYGCTECNDCFESGECSMTDDMDEVYEAIELADRIILAAPIFFMGLPAQTKAMIDRCQRYWAIKYMLKQAFPRPSNAPARYAAYIGIGGTSGSKLFDGTMLTLKYFFDAIDMQPLEDHYILVRGVDDQGEINENKVSLGDAYELGKYIVGLG